MTDLNKLSEPEVFRLVTMAAVHEAQRRNVRLDTLDVYSAIEAIVKDIVAAQSIEEFTPEFIARYEKKPCSTCNAETSQWIEHERSCPENKEEW